MTKTNRFFRRERSGLFLSKYYLFTKTIYQIVRKLLSVLIETSSINDNDYHIR